MPLPVISIVQMREWEKATWAAGRTEADVIRRVGKAVADSALRLTAPGDSILILAGKGHNGDDARAAREHLIDRRVEILNVTDPKAALEEFAERTGAHGDVRPTGLIIDGLFGIGIDRPLDDDWKKLIKAINETKLPVLAVDVPSGLNADTGEPQGAAVEGAVTLTVGAPKFGMLKQHAWQYVGQLDVATDVGLIPCPHKSELQWTLPDDFAGFPPRRLAATHKGNFGHLAIVAGSAGYHGAAVLAARGAQHAQPGLITLFTHQPVYPMIASQLQSVMVGVWESALKLRDEFSAILVGPGLAAGTLPDEMKITTQRLWRNTPVPMIVDASALDWLPSGVTSSEAIGVITPHPGEAAVMLRATAKEVQNDRLDALRQLSKRYGDCWVVLKGHQTLIGRSSGEISVNSSGNPFLAQGGSGDVLGGYIAGFLAQPALVRDAGLAIRYAVWQHGATADALQARRKAWVVEDLVSELGMA